MNALHLSLRPTETQHAHDESFISITRVTPSVCPSAQACIHPRCYSVKSSLSASRQVNSRAVGDLATKMKGDGKTLGFYCSVLFCVALIPALFLLSSSSPRLCGTEENGGARGFCLPFIGRQQELHLLV